MKAVESLVLQVAVICILFVGVIFAPPVDDGPKEGAGKVEDPAPAPPSTTTTTTVSPTVSNNINNTKCAGTNQTNCPDNGPSDNLLEQLKKNKGMLKRAVYVLLGVTAVVLIYFGLRMWRTKRRRSKTKKYGVITTPASDLEMTPLDQDDDDEDMTVFEVNGLHK